MFGFLFAWISWSLIGLVQFLVWLLVALMFGLWWCQGHLLYLPNYQNRKGEMRKVHHNLEGYRSPEDQGIPFEEYYVTTEDGVKIHTWLLTQDNKTQVPTLVFFHGNAGNIGFRLPNARQLYMYTGCNVYLVEYRGYGNSEGTPSEQGLKLDAVAALNFLHSHTEVDNEKLYVFGRSLGGAVALSLAHALPYKIRGVIVENTFTSINDMVLVLLGRFGVTKGHTYFKYFLMFYLTSKWRSAELAAEISVPILYISGLSDELIPPAHMKKLFTISLRSPDKQFYGVGGGEHNDTYIRGGHAYYDRLSEFISTTL